MIDSDIVTDELAGRTIKEMFRNADDIARLHACLTSPRGDYFRFRLLQAMEFPLDDTAMERHRVQSGINEYHRHLHRLFRFGLIRVEKIDGDKQYIRTALAERAINAVREFERRVSREAARAIYVASLGPNSIHLFLWIYGNQAKGTWEESPLRYTPAEMGRLSLFLPRIIEGISAIDKLHVADLVVYHDDNYIYVQSVKARSFYQYLRQLYEMLRADRYHTSETAPR